MLINLEKKPEIIAKNVARCREKGITLPTFAQMKNPDLIPQSVKDSLKDVGLWDSIGKLSYGNSDTVRAMVMFYVLCSILKGA